MPLISRFLGIRVYMYFDDHPPAHFHVRYGEYQAEFDIETLGLLAGKLPRRVHSLVIEWAVLHQAELRVNWDLAREGLPVNRIEALE